MDYQKLASKLLDKAKKAGATQAEVYLQSAEELEIEINKEKMQKLNRSAIKGVGLRIYVDKKMSFVYSSDFTEKELDKLVEKGVALANEGMEDKFNILPSPSGTPPKLDIFDPELANIDLQKKIDYARELDRLVFEIDPRVANTRASSYYDGYGDLIIANTNGLVHSLQASYCGVGTSPVIEDKGLKQVAYYGTAARYYNDIPPAKEIAEEAVRRASLLIGGEKVRTQKVPVVFDFQVGARLFGGILSAVNGERVFRGESFLVDKLEEGIASELVTIIDDGLVPKGMGSYPVDDEGVVTTTKKVVDKGVLKLYLYDSYTANKVGTKSTGNASRGSYSSRPSIGPTNFYLEKGD
ncbi:MAG: TldD/PmbA family protein, partial [Candidatus Aminicenantes bacterium]|nr:TldD/PmbA family protein [Candidatus Aminicenantes bacterium]